MTTVKPTGKQLLSLVGNPEAYAVQHADGSWHPVREPLTAKVIKAHRNGDVTVGTYVVNPPDQARTLVFDIDSGDDQELSDILDVLLVLGLRSAVEFSGRKGWHVWVLVAEYMDAAVLYRLGRGIREEIGRPALEVFPKQTEVRDLGNLVKLPGGVHRVTGKPNDFITQGHSLEGKRPNSVVEVTSAANLYPEVGLRKRHGDSPLVVQYPCVNDIQDGVKEGGRNTHLFHLATMLRRWSINDDNIRAILLRANDRSPDGPIPRDELEDIIANSEFSGPVCNQLDDSVHCGEQCLLTRYKGLTPRTGALKWASEGETVVVSVASRTEGGTVVELGHPDVVQARAILAEPRKEKTDD